MMSTMLSEQQIEKMGDERLCDVEVDFISDSTVKLSCCIPDAGDFRVYIKKQGALGFEESDHHFQLSQRQFDVGDKRIALTANVGDTLFIVGALKSLQKVRSRSLNVHPLRMQMPWRDILPFPHQLKWERSVGSEMASVVDCPTKCALYRQVHGQSQMYATSRVVFLEGRRGHRFAEPVAEDVLAVLVCVLDHGNAVRTPLSKLADVRIAVPSPSDTPDTDTHSKRKWIFVAIGVLCAIGSLVVALLCFHCARTRKETVVTREPHTSPLAVRPPMRKYSFRRKSSIKQEYTDEGM